MDVNDRDSPASRALEYLCQVGHGDRPAWFVVSSLIADLELPAQDGREIFRYLVGKGVARFMGFGKNSIIPTDAGFRRMGYSNPRRGGRDARRRISAREDI